MPDLVDTSLTPEEESRLIPLEEFQPPTQVEPEVPRGPPIGLTPEEEGRLIPLEEFELTPEEEGRLIPLDNFSPTEQLQLKARQRAMDGGFSPQEVDRAGEDVLIAEEVGLTLGITREALGQGFGLGFGDEGEAVVRSIVNGTTYEDELDVVRREIGAFKAVNPKTALAADIGGSLAFGLVPGLGAIGAVQKGASLAQAARTGAKAGLGFGAVSGFGRGEGGVSERAIEAGVGGVVGGAAGGVLTPGIIGIARAIRGRPVNGSAGTGAARVEDTVKPQGSSDKELNTNSPEVDVAPQSAPEDNPAVWTGDARSSVGAVQAEVGRKGAAGMDAPPYRDKFNEKVAEDFEEEATATVLNQPFIRSLFNAYRDILEEGGITEAEVAAARENGKQITDFVADLFQSGRISSDKVNGIFARHHVNPADLIDDFHGEKGVLLALGDAVRGTLSEAGRVLNEASLAVRFPELLDEGLGASAGAMRVLFTQLDPVEVLKRPDVKVASQANSYFGRWLTSGLNSIQRISDLSKVWAVSQLKTAVRDGEMTGVNLGLNSITRAMEGGIIKLAGNPLLRATGNTPIEPGMVGAWDGFQDFGRVLGLTGQTLASGLRGLQEVATGQRSPGEFLNLAQATASIEKQDPAIPAIVQQVREIAKISPEVRHQFGRYIPDIIANTTGRSKTGVLARLERIGHTLNYFNRLQSQIVRAGVLNANMARRLERIGDRELGTTIEAANKTINGLEAQLVGAKGLARSRLQGKLKRLRNKYDVAAEGAMADALEVSFGRDFKHIQGGIVVDAVKPLFEALNKVPFFPQPFMRFMFDSLRWQYEHSPLGALSLASPKELALFYKGNLTAKEFTRLKARQASRVLAGTGMAYGAYAIRENFGEGLEWYKLRVPRVGVVDMRPFAPFSQYLFWAEFAKRHVDAGGKGVPQFSAEEMIAAVAGGTFRTGVGLSVVDNLMGSLQNIDPVNKMESVERVFSKYADDILSRFMSPLRMFRDFYDFTQGNERLLRDKQTTGFGASAMELFTPSELPERQSPTRAATQRRLSPLLGQLTGITRVEDVNAAEAELNRLGFAPKEIFPRTGDPVLNLLAKKHMGPLIERGIGQLVQNEGYAFAKDATKAVFLKENMQKLKSAAVALARTEDLARGWRAKIRKMPKRLRILLRKKLEEQGRSFKDIETLLREMQSRQAR